MLLIRFSVARSEYRGLSYSSVDCCAASGNNVRIERRSMGRQTRIRGVRDTPVTRATRISVVEQHRVWVLSGVGAEYEPIFANRSEERIA